MKRRSIKNCPQREKQLWLYVLDEIPEDQRSDFAAHLEHCAACRAEHQRISAILGKIRSADGRVSLRVGEADAMTRSILDAYSPKIRFQNERRKRVRPRLPALSAAAAAVFIIFAVFGIYRWTQPDSEMPFTAVFPETQQRSSDASEMLQDLDLLREFQTVEKLATVLEEADAPAPGMYEDDSVWIEKRDDFKTNLA